MHVSPLPAQTAPVSHGSLPVELDHIRAVAARINASLTEVDVLANFVAIAAAESGAAAVLVAMVGGDDPDPKVTATDGIPIGFVAGWYELHIGSAIAGPTIQHNQVNVIGDMHLDPQLAPRQREWVATYGFRAAWAVPLPAKSGEPAGALVMLYRGPFEPEASQLLVFQLYAQHAAMALDNARLHDVLRVQAIRDSKTGLYTHDYLMEAIRRELARSSRGAAAPALLMMDIDNYKQFNDSYGHLMGDRVLAIVADVISRYVRAVDTPARFGGEEFAVLLPSTAISDAMNIAERIRASIETVRLPLVDASVTVSVGVAIATDGGLNPDPFLGAADAALYQAKHCGKNVVRAASG